MNTGTHLEADVVLPHITNANNYPQSEQRGITHTHTHTHAHARKRALHPVNSPQHSSNLDGTEAACAMGSPAHLLPSYDLRRVTAILWARNARNGVMITPASQDCTGERLMQDNRGRGCRARAQGLRTGLVNEPKTPEGFARYLELGQVPHCLPTWSHSKLLSGEPSGSSFIPLKNYIKVPTF